MVVSSALWPENARCWAAELMRWADHWKHRDGRGWTSDLFERLVFFCFFWGVDDWTNKNIFLWLRRGYPQGISRGSSSHFYVWTFKTLSPPSRIVCRHGSPNNHMLVVFSKNVHRYYITHTYIYAYVGKWWERLDQTWETIGTYADLLYQNTARNRHIKIQPFNKTIIEIMLDLAISSSRTASSTCGYWCSWRCVWGKS